MRVVPDRIVDGVVIAFCALRIIAVVGLPAGRLPDSPEYEHLSFSGNELRPWALPLLYRYVTSDGARILMQAVLGAIAWSVLATTVAAGINDQRVRRVTVIALLALGLGVPITSWDTMMLSESLGLSLLALLIAAWVRWLRRPGWPTGALLVGITCVWTFVRQDHLYVTWVLLVVVTVVAIVRRRDAVVRVAWAALAVAFLALSVWGQLAYSKNRTLADFNVAESIADRIIPNKDRAEWFIDRGMPVPDGTTPGEYIYNQPPGELVLRDPEFKRWVHEHGVSTYTRFLATHPWYTFVGPLGDFLGNSSPTIGPRQTGLSMLAPTDLYGQARAVDPILVEVILLTPGNAGSALVGFVVVVVALALQWRRYGYDARWSVPIAVLAIGIPFLWVVWHASSIEVARHAIDIAISGRMALLMLGAVLVDRWIAERSPQARASL